MRYLQHAVIRIGNPPQSQPLNSRQVQNSAGGYSFAVDKWGRLDRFLILGSEGGSYYADEQKLTAENVKCLEECVKEDGPKAVARVLEISKSGRAPKNEPALLALAYAASKGDTQTRSDAFDALPKVARIGTHLFNFASYVDGMRGWGRGLRNAIGSWYNDQDPEKLANQVTKYQSRVTAEGDPSSKWSHRDLYRLAHTKPASRAHQAIAKWVVKGGELNKTAPEKLIGHTELQEAKTPKQAVKLIRKYGLVRENVPTELLKSPEVWDALLENMPMTAMIRNLGNLSKCGLLVPLSDAAKLVTDRLADDKMLKDARVHPIQLLIAEKTYGSGHSARGKGQWTIVPPVVDALNGAFYASFKTVDPTGKRFYLGLDVSGSMSDGEVAGVEGFTPREASAAMAMVTARTESQYYVGAFQDQMTELKISPRDKLTDICRQTERLSFGATDCSMPMLDALQKKLNVDTFVVYTDSETWAGRVHPVKALQLYRQQTGIPAKLIVCGMVSNGFTIADPDDAGMLDVVGFDSATPQLISEFSKA
jgi:60 kDa SS-A/Ro ribonucleoprotein